MPDSVRIALELSPNSEDLEALGQALSAFNLAKGGPDDFERIFFSLRNEAGELQGGLVAATYWGWLFVDLLFVKEAHRGLGLGSSLLARAEALALERGARHAFLDTFSFQAEEFYRRRGYITFGALDQFPTGHRRVWMTKPLGPRDGAQSA